MNPITTAIVAALADLAKPAVKDAYEGLKAVIHRKWGSPEWRPGSFRFPSVTTIRRQVTGNRIMRLYLNLGRRGYAPFSEVNLL